MKTTRVEIQVDKAQFEGGLSFDETWMCSSAVIGLCASLVPEQLFLRLSIRRLIIESRNALVDEFVHGKFAQNVRPAKHSTRVRYSVASGESSDTN